MIRRLRPAASFIRDVWHEFIQDRGALFAAAISFFGLISMIPLILLAVGIFGYIIGSRAGALDKVLEFLSDFIPIGTNLLQQYLQGLSKESRLLSWIGFAGLLWAGMQVFVIIQQVMNVALGTAKHVSFLRARVVAVILVLVAGMLFALSIGVTSLITAARHYQPQILGFRVPALDLFWQFIGVLVPMLISVIAFTIIYKFTPVGNIGTKGPIIGGLTSGILFEIAKNAFKWYFSHLGNFSVVYGSLGSVVTIVFWTYYVSLITVLGAEVASVYVRREGGDSISGG